MRRRRNLSAEERELWSKVAERATPLERKSRHERPLLDTKTKARPVDPHPVPHSTPTPRISQFRLGEKAHSMLRHDLMPSVGDRLGAAPLQMDAKSFGKMKRGKLSPDARIDLHGMTVAEAHPALISFVMWAYSEGHRLALVITGKGKDRDDGGPIPTKNGVLRHQVPQWLRMVPLKNVILQVTPAHIRHGGHGAYYVYLKRNG